METNVKKEDKFNRKVNLQDFEKNVDLSKLFKFKINLKVIQFSNTYIYKFRRKNTRISKDLNPSKIVNLRREEERFERKNFSREMEGGKGVSGPRDSIVGGKKVGGMIAE